MRFKKQAQNRLLRINEKVEEEIANNIISEGAFDTEADRNRVQAARFVELNDDFTSRERYTDKEIDIGKDKIDKAD